MVVLTVWTSIWTTSCSVVSAKFEICQSPCEPLYSEFAFMIPDGVGYFFHMFIGHLDIFFYEVVCLIFFLNCLSPVDLSEFFI